MASLFIYFFVYSVLGWASETLTQSIHLKRFAIRGFLYGPYCPIYGFGALGIIIATRGIAGNPLLVFLVAISMSSVLEYLTSWTMEKMFHMRWWDYSDRKFNLNGRICLQNAVGFSLMAVVMVSIAHPIFSAFVVGLGTKWDTVIALTLFVVMAVDMVFTLFALLKLGKRLRAFERDVAEWSENAMAAFRSRIAGCDNEYRHLRIFPNFIPKPERRAK